MSTYYKKIAWEDNLMRTINEYAKDGYELVSVCPSISMNCYLLIFK